VQSSLQMSQMIADLLERSLLEAGRADLHLGLVNLVEVVMRSIDQTTTPADRARIEVDAGAPLLVVVDAARIVRVLGNLLTNACKYSAADLPVRVQVSCVDQQAVIAVTDQGVGIDDDELPQVFAKHYRARTSGTTAGTGLGLYSSRLIVDAHGGRLWAESTVGVGSR
jgi:signal transduction histidine kinase